MAMREVSHRYGNRVALRRVSLSARSGDIVGLIGKNGAGKTTLLRIAAGLLVPLAGEVTVGGRAAATRRGRELVGFVPDEPGLDGDATVEEYLTSMARLGGVGRRDVAERVTWVVERCQLDGVRRRLVRGLSRGFRQRVALAQAIVHHPKVVLLDEPTTGLDPPQIRHFHQLLQTLPGRPAVVLSSHLLPQVAEVATRVVVIHDGAIVASGAPGSVECRVEVHDDPETLWRLRHRRPSLTIRSGPGDTVELTVRGEDDTIGLLDELQAAGLPILAVIEEPRSVGAV